MTRTLCPRLEVPIFGPDAGALAVSLGVSRLELNHAGSYPLGGTTPTLSELSTLLASLTQSSPPAGSHRPPIRIMIRPRGGPPSQANPTPDRQAHETTQKRQEQQDFIYTPAELSTMAASIEQFIASGLLDPRRGDGFVFGLLRYHRYNNTTSGGGGGEVGLDVEGNRRLVTVAKKGGEGFVCVLHRAVDDVFTLGCCDGLGSGAGTGAGTGVGKGGGGEVDVDVEEVMARVAECGFDGVLTSGGRGRAVDNMARLERVVEARGAVEVIVGGGVRSENLRSLVESLGEGGRGEGVWFHSSCFGGGEGFDEEEARALAEEMGDLGLVLQ